jgi:hypothetical protein
VACLPVLLVLSVLLCLLQSASVIMSQTHGSPGPRLEALSEELREEERFMSHGYQSFQYLLEALKSSGHSQCTTVWTKDTVAYAVALARLPTRGQHLHSLLCFFTRPPSPPPPPHPVASSQSGSGFLMLLSLLSFYSFRLFMIAKVISMSKMDLQLIVLETRVRSFHIAFETLYTIFLIRMNSFGHLIEPCDELKPILLSNQYVAMAILA